MAKFTAKIWDTYLHKLFSIPQGVETQKWTLRSNETRLYYYMYFIQLATSTNMQNLFNITLRITISRARELSLIYSLRNCTVFKIGRSIKKSAHFNHLNISLLCFNRALSTGSFPELFPFFLASCCCSLWMSSSSSWRPMRALCVCGGGGCVWGDVCVWG